MIVATWMSREAADARPCQGCGEKGWVAEIIVGEGDVGGEGDVRRYILICLGCFKEIAKQLGFELKRTAP